MGCEKRRPVPKRPHPRPSRRPRASPGTGGNADAKQIQIAKNSKKAGFSNMNAIDFQNRMTGLIPGIDPKAMQNMQGYAAELDRDETHPETEFYKEMYVEFCLVKKQYGVEIARQLIDLAKTHCLNPFEVRGAANLLRDGVSLEQIGQRSIDGECDPTAQEWDEFQTTLREFEKTGQVSDTLLAAASDEPQRVIPTVPAPPPLRPHKKKDMGAI
jgi:hypothetical protein